MKISHPLIERLHRLQVEKASGKLEVKGDEESVYFHLADGRIAAVESGNADYRLGTLLSREKLVRSWAVRKLRLRAARKRRPLGEVAVERSALRQSKLLQVLVLQASSLFQRCIDRDYRVARFKSGESPFRFSCDMPVSALVLRLARSCNKSYAGSLNDVIESLPKADQDFAEIPWKPDEIELLNRLKQPRRVGQLIEESFCPRERVLETLGVLQVAGLVRPSSRPAGSGEPPDEQGPTWIIPSVSTRFVSDKLEIFKDQYSFVSEQFKTLKTRLSEFEKDRKLQVIGVSSPFMGDGKSLVCSNLALSLSQDPERRVILLDCDLRRPSMHDYLGVLPDPGMSQYLAESHEPDFHCYVRRFNTLDIMSVGEVADNPVELLSLDRMSELIRKLRREYDTIVIDCPPFEPISDARILTGLADGTVLVIRSGSTPFAWADKVVKTVSRERILGVVLNEVKPVLFNTYYSYNYYYYGESGAYPYYARKDERK